MTDAPDNGRDARGAGDSVDSGEDGEVPPELVEVQSAATVMVIRDRPAPAEGPGTGSGSNRGPGSGSAGEPDIEAYLLRRRPGSVFVPDVHVFPGGRVDPDDQHLVDLSLTNGAPGGGTGTEADGPEADNAEPGLAFWVAAVRETFEETGLLLATGPPGALDRAMESRAEVDLGTLAFSTVCTTHHLLLDTASISYFGHWVTPVGPPRRYDTQFFIAVCPPGQEPSPDGVEAVDALWITPTAAVEACVSSEIDFILPTYRSLLALTRFTSVEEVRAALSPVGGKTGRMEAELGGGSRVSLPETGRARGFPPIPPEIRARRGTDG